MIALFSFILSPRRNLRWLCAALSITAAGTLAAQSGTTGNQPLNIQRAIQETSRNYQLRPTDQIAITVFGEGDLSVTQRIDGDGNINMPLLGKTSMSGRTVREAELFLRNQFISQRYLRDPQVTVGIVQYSVKQFYVFGEVNAPGMKVFPLEEDKLDIIEVISMAGDFTDLASGDAVRVTRKGADGREVVYNVEAESLIVGDKRDRNKKPTFFVLPGDVVYVPERFF